jgi:hypothetical protein
VTDWDRVQRLRAKGLDWGSIAEDPKVGFTAPEGVEDPGRALKTLYLARRSRSKRTGKPLRDGARVVEMTESHEGRRRALAVVGLIVLIGGILWLALAVAYPIAGFWVAAFPPQFPDILIVVFVGLALVVVSVIMDVGVLAMDWKKGIVAGIVVGLVLSGVSVVVAQSAGVPSLSSSTTPEPNSWVKAANPVWTGGGKPVVFFYGSEACPYCSAGSWAIFEALQQFGTWSGTGYASSSPTDVYPNTPEVSLSGSSLASSYISWDPREDPDTQQINAPSTDAVEHAYVSTYDSGGSIPFFVVGGVYIHVGSLVSPAVLQGLSASQVAQSMSTANPSDPVYSAVNGVAVYIEAFIVKVLETNGMTAPSSVTSNSEVQTALGNIS